MSKLLQLRPSILKLQKRSAVTSLSISRCFQTARSLAVKRDESGIPNSQNTILPQWRQWQHRFNSTTTSDDDGTAETPLPPPSPYGEYSVHIPIHMPHLDLSSDGDKQGVEHTKNKIIAWHKSPGDIIQPNDALCDIETPLFTFGMMFDEDDEECIMGEIFVEACDEQSSSDANEVYAKDGEIICMTYQKPDEEDIKNGLSKGGASTTAPPS